jgi:hypothetical protein
MHCWHHAVKQDKILRQNGDQALIDDKAVFIIKRTKRKEHPPLQAIGLSAD